MLPSNLLKNVISKDKNIFENTIKEIVKTKNIEAFKEICKNSEFIFPNIREKISNYFVKIINKDDLDLIFEFSKTYTADFEDIVVNSLLKFADEDLTDEILELFDTGINEQKAYCARYFSRINDSLALESLEKYVYSEFEPLRINSVLALKSFKKNDILFKIKNEILETENEFDKIPLYQILSAWGGADNIKFVVENSLTSPYSGNIISSVLDYSEFEKLKQFLDKDSVFKIFNVLIENYPENIELSTISYYQIYDFIRYLFKNLNQYSNNLLSLAKKQFLEYQENEIYNFDLDKNTKEELKNINTFLKDFKPDFTNIESELDTEDLLKFETAIKVIQEYKIEVENKLAEMINNSSIHLNKKALIAQTLKVLEKTNLIDKEKISNLENENIKALILSLI